MKTCAALVENCLKECQSLLDFAADPLLQNHLDPDQIKTMLHAATVALQNLHDQLLFKNASMTVQEKTNDQLQIIKNAIAFATKYLNDCCGNQLSQRDAIASNKQTSQNNDDTNFRLDAQKRLKNLRQKVLVNTTLHQQVLADTQHAKTEELQ